MTIRQKMAIILLKYAPVISSVVMMGHVATLLLYKELYFAEWTFSLPVFPWLVCMVWSKAFGFCVMHRAFISYTALVSFCIKYQDLFGFGWFLEGTRITLLFIGMVLLIWLFIHTHKHYGWYSDTKKITCSGY